MIFFHGTLEENLKKIKKDGLLNLTRDQWITEVTQQNVCCVSNQPTSGEGGNASFFAYGNTKVKNQDGYLVVIEMPANAFQEKLITIFNNQILDHYVRYHFFVRQEFRKIGYLLYTAFTEYRKKDRHFQKLGDCFSSVASQVMYKEDQTDYYKNLYKGTWKNFSLLDITVTQEFYDFMQHIGNWSSFYQFLLFHFMDAEPNRLDDLNNKSLTNKEYWQKFYQYFPMNLKEEKHKYMANWFSCEWLKSRQQQEIDDNSQILLKKIEKKYVKGFIKITTPSGFAEKFRSCRSGAGFAKEIWRQVHKM